MNTPSFFNDIEYIRAAPDAQLSSSETQLLTTLLSEENQHDYNQLLKIQLSQNILSIIHQLSSLLDLSSSTIWMTIILLKKLLIQQYSINLLTIIATITLSLKYQDSSSNNIDYEFISQYCHIENIQHIHDAENDLLDFFSYDISITTPDHFFSYLSNLVNNNNNSLKEIIEQARCLLSFNSLSYEIFELLHQYPSSVVALSLISNITSNNFIVEQIKSFLLHSKDPTYYFTQFCNCITQLQSTTSK